MTNYNWEKKGLIYVPTGDGFFKTHAARSIPYQVSDRVLRLYFCSRDDDDRLLPTYVDVDIHDPGRVLHINEKALLGLGRIGTFDDSGVTPGSIVKLGKEVLIYYTGWKRRRINVPFELSIGICRVSSNGVTFERMWDGPILAQDRNHPILTAGPFVMHDHDLFKMWYCSGTEWRICEGNPEPIYHVCYAESDNGIDWIPRLKPVIDYKYDGEVISAPWVIKHNSKYYMWYSTRGSSTRDAKRYVIGYAESEDGVEWVRMDDRVGISRSVSGWDSEMICYPSFFPVGDKIYMFYSGNNVGKGGMGYAVMENFLN
jgi:hypothetical protein